MSEPTVDIPLTLTDLLISKQVYNSTLNVWYRNDNPSAKQAELQRQLAVVERKVSNAIMELSGGVPNG